MSNKTTRRTFLRASATAAVLPGCAHRGEDTRGEAAANPTTANSPASGERVEVRTRINGRDHVLQVAAEDTALDIVRTRIGLKGAKLGCGHGVCGACTLRLDGTPVATCVLPATSLHNASLTTVEGIAEGKRLHPMQRAFMAEDAMQCGFCTPGFIVGATSFFTAWRAARGRTSPPRDAVAAALSGHLCRCGAYEGIISAVQRACEGVYDAEVGDPPRYDARAKVTGEARYTVDVESPGMLWALALHSPHGHARVTRLDWSRALALPGVRGAVDLLGASRLVRYAGQEIMAIAAVDQTTARRALQEVDVEYDVLDALIDPERARDSSSAPIFALRTERKNPARAAEGPVVPAAWHGNLRGPFQLFSKRKLAARRAVARARSGGGVLAEGTFSTAHQCHTCLEPHAAVAEWKGKTSLTVHVSTQAVSHVKREIAERFGLDEEKVVVLADYVGGGFGSKATLSTETVIAIELARICGAPVR